MDLVLDDGLERAQEEAELGVEREAILADVKPAGNAWTLEGDRVAVPLVLEIEAALEIARDLLRDVAGFLVRQVVRLGDRNRGHCRSFRPRSIANAFSAWEHAPAPVACVVAGGHRIMGTAGS